MLYCKENNENILYSPLNLLYTAWSDQQTTVNQIITENYAALDGFFSPLSERDRHSVYQAICRICAEREKLAFFEGLRTGARIVSELAEA